MVATNEGAVKMTDYLEASQRADTTPGRGGIFTKIEEWEWSGRGGKWSGG